MNITDINIRDPFVLVFQDKYYLYGTRAATCWGAATGFDCYVSNDLKEWDGPYEVFHKPDNFWADKNCWAPEVHEYQGYFYMFATFKDSKKHGGTAILRSDSPLGPFEEHSECQVTPLDWECIDGTFFLSADNIPYIVFVHEWTQISDGSICAMELSKDLKKSVSEPFLLFHASEATPWVKPISNRHKSGLHYVTDGPFLYRTENGRLIMIWSSFGEEGYAEAISYSDNGELTGTWRHDSKLLFTRDGGHGMIFKDLNGKTFLTLHVPNETLMERPVFYEIEERNGSIEIK